MRYFLLNCLLFCVTLSVQAQDTILRTNGDEVKARVLAITPTDVAYVPTTEPPTTDTLHLLATEVFLIRYANGTKEVVSKPAATAPAIGLSRTPQEMSNLGREDARKYFKSPGVFWGTAGATFVSIPAYGLGGIATGAAIAATPPKRHNMIVPDQVLLNDPNYVSGYQKQAQRQKLGKAAGGFGVGIAAGAVATVAIVAAIFNAY
ncbi:hypothetical protein H8B13_04395 [Hymenobacter sp. BT188]|uniref:hypothetical protein n=1 Tax=Hymenobacter sp. BT188 TaxID=2763504 RepID=UPI0016514822|nr:hypothetical protein [Hymenobacter sp. BT188]MBC6606051.1 hypothetical protein [Hymenobacter sp. BT188]